MKPYLCINQDRHCIGNVHHILHKFIFLLGPVLPGKPVQLRHTNVTSDLAIVEWLIPEVTYTPETYTVRYGVDQMVLNFSSSMLTGTRDIAATNQVYSTSISGLLPNTTYFYQVVAVNVIGSNSSRIMQLTTPSPGDVSLTYHVHNVQHRKFTLKVYQQLKQSKMYIMCTA